MSDSESSSEAFKSPHFSKILGGGIQFKTGGLKKANAKLPFVEYEISSYIGQLNVSPRERMRQLDLFYMHSPDPEKECKFLNLPSDRISLHSLKGIMFLCGGLVGMRFENDDFHNLSSYLKDMSILWTNLNDVFQKVVESDKKISSGSPKEEKSLSSDYTQELIQEFNKVADEYLAIVFKVQEIVKRKQSLIDRDHSKLNDISTKIDPDPESRMGSPYPMWFNVLKDKYNQYIAIDHATHHHNKVNFTIGKFSVFICLCIDGVVNCTPEEQICLSEILDASKDFKEIFHYDANHNHHNPTNSSSHENSHKKYLSHRIFNFLKAVPELKSIVRDENAIDTMRFL